MIVTIDGPAGAGKSTVARLLARRLDFHYLDTGAMYRAVALAGLRDEVDWGVEEGVADLIDSLEIRWDGDRILVNGEDVAERIRSSEVTATVGMAADHPLVRRYLVRAQRAFGEGVSLVTEGRDQGSVAFPRADCKIFLEADPKERAKRRLEDLREQGELVDFDTVLADIERRDLQDRSRPVGALVMPEGAVTVSTDGLTVEEVVDRLEQIVRDRGMANAEPGDLLPKSET